MSLLVLISSACIYRRVGWSRSLVVLLKNCITLLGEAITDQELSFNAFVFQCSKFIYGPTVTVAEPPSLEAIETAHGQPVNE